MTSDILGVWALRAFTMENLDTGERSEPFGPEPRGTLMLHPDGRMAALITPRDGPAPAAGEAGPPRIIAYSGRFRLEPPDRLVTMVDVAWFAEWIGTEQARTYRVEADRLEIRTPPGRMPRPGAEAVTVAGLLSWVREAATPG